MIIVPDSIKAELEELGRRHADNVFAVWSADGDFKPLYKAAIASINELGEKLGRPLGETQVQWLQWLGWDAFCHRKSALTEQWDATFAREAEAQERAPGRRRRRQHHVRSVHR